MKPVLLPQYVPLRLANANSIMNVVRAISTGLNAAGGRIIAPNSRSLFGYDASIFCKMLDEWPILSGFSMDVGPQFAKHLTIDDDEYIVNVTPFFSFGLHRMAKFKGRRFDKPTIVNYVLFAPIEIETGHREVCASLCEFPSVFNSEHNRRLWVEECRKYASASEVKRMVDRSDVIHIGIRCDEIDKKPFVGSKGTICHCGRLAAHKNFDRVVTISGLAFMTGTKVKLVTSTFGKSSCEKMTEIAKTSEFVKPHFDLDRSVFLDLIREADGFLCCSKSESYGLSWLEKLYAGQVGIFVDRPWVRALVDSHAPNRYPFIFGSNEEAVSMLKQLVEDPDSMRSQIAWVKDMIREKHNVSTTASRFFEACGKLAE